MLFKLLRDDYLKLIFLLLLLIFLKVKIYIFRILILNYLCIVYLLLRSVNILSFVCETYIYIFLVIKTLYTLFSIQKTNH